LSHPDKQKDQQTGLHIGSHRHSFTQSNDTIEMVFLCLAWTSSTDMCLCKKWCWGHVVATQCEWGRL